MHTNTQSLSPFLSDVAAYIVVVVATDVVVATVVATTNVVVATTTLSATDTLATIDVVDACVVLMLL